MAAKVIRNEPVEFEKEPVEVQDFRKITDRFRRMYKNIPQNNKGKSSYDMND